MAVRRHAWVGPLADALRDLGEIGMRATRPAHADGIHPRHRMAFEQDAYQMLAARGVASPIVGKDDQPCHGGECSKRGGSRPTLSTTSEVDGPSRPRAALVIYSR